MTQHEEHGPLGAIFDFLSFPDWTRRQPIDPAGWIVVAQHVREGDEDYFTTSVLVKPSNDESILASNEWDVDNTFGTPCFWAKGGDKIATYDPGDVQTNGQITFLPFTTFRNQNGLVGERFELRQEYLLYHDTYYVEEAAEYRRIDRDGNEIPVVRVAGSPENPRLLCEEHELRDFLAAKQCALVRYHDHRRFSESRTDHIVELKRDLIKLTASDAIYLVRISATSIPLSNYESFSRLLGKDIVRPYAAPASYHTDWMTLEASKQYASFVIGRDDQGREIESACNMNDPSSADFLTNVFFERKVLQKYAREPRRFAVDATYLSCLYQWGIPIDINPAGLVHVYLGDLARLPYAEQLHWRSHNVVGRGGMSPERFQRDFMVQPADPRGDVAFDFKRAFAHFQESSLKVWGAQPFKALTGADAHILNGIRGPFSEEQQELDEQMRWLATLLPDSLDVAVLEALTAEKIQEGRRIALLERLLQKAAMNEGTLRRLIRALQAVQALRSSGAAHRKGGEYNRAIRSFGFERQNGQQIISALLRDLASGLDAAADAIESGK